MPESSRHFFQQRQIVPKDRFHANRKLLHFDRGGFRHSIHWKAQNWRIRYVFVGFGCVIAGNHGIDFIAGEACPE